MEIEKLEASENQQLELANTLTVNSVETYTGAGELLKGVKALEKEIDATFDPIIKKAHAAHKEAVAQAKRHMEPLLQAERIIKSKISTWQLAQEAEQRKKELELQAAAQRDAEALAMAQAKQAEDAGDVQQAAAILEAPVVAPAVVLAPSTPVLAGISYVKQWDFEIENVALIPRKYMVPDEKAIRAVVRALKGQHGIMGIRAFEKQIVSARG